MFLPSFAGKEPLIVKIYIHKLPIHRTHAADYYTCSAVDLILNQVKEVKAPIEVYKSRLVPWPDSYPN